MISQISTSNTFGQLVTSVSALIAVSNNMVGDGQSQTNSSWTFTNPGVGINVGNTARISTGNISILNSSTANITGLTVSTSNISTANITIANVVGATITDLNSTRIVTSNANVTLLQVTTANVFSMNAQSANIGALSLTTLNVTGLTVSTLNTSFANITDALITGTFQAIAIQATLTTTSNANVGILNLSTANITGETVKTSNISFANITSLNVGSMNLTSANITTLTGLSTLTTAFAGITLANIDTLNASTANISNLTVVQINASIANLTTGTMAANPTTNLSIATKNYVDTGAGGNLVNKITFAAKGDLVVGTGANTFTNLPTTSNGRVLVVDTVQATGLRYAARPTTSFRGLTLTTSMADRIANGTQLVVYTLDETIMDDGEVVSGWPNQSVLDISVSGVNGLDGGTANANTWYEVYAIRKSSDGVKNFIVHRALDRLATQNTFNSSFWPIQSGLSAGLGANNTSNLYIRLAQSFTPNVTGNLTSLEIRAHRTTTPTGNMWLTLEANTAGSPGGTTLATSRKMNVALLPLTNLSNVRFVFDNTTTVTTGTSYFWVFNSDYPASTTAYINVGFSLANTDITANGVNRGLPYGNTGTSWLQLTSIGTFIYKAYVESNNFPVTMPAGYDQKCLIGYVATDRTGKLKESYQKDRTITINPYPDWAAYTLQIANPEVIDLGQNATIPPISCLVSFFATGTSQNTIGLGRFHALNLLGTPQNADMPAGATFMQISSPAAVASASPMIWVEHQAVLVKSNLAAARFFPASITF